MGKIISAAAWCNGEVAYLAWRADEPIADCLGFMITRVQVASDGTQTRRVLPTWIAFKDQSNPKWLDQDSSVWPIQQYQWRDLTLRRSRNTAAVRPIDFAVFYEIVPVGTPGPGRPPVPQTDTAIYKDADGNPRYQGPRHALAIVGEMFATEPVDVTHAYGSVKATYTNGILSTQNLLQQLEAVQGTSPAGVTPGPTTGITPGLLSTLKAHIPLEGDAIRTFLTGDVLAFLLALIDRAEQEGGVLHLALYELHDPELIRRLTKLTKAGKAHVILSTAGNTDLNPKDAPPPKQPVVWDTENHDARVGLHAAKPANVQDRLFNNADHIGHNKFAVYVKDGKAKAVLSGSTNWTETGLCTQSNNAILIEDPAVSELYLAYWKRLLADPQPPGVDLTVQVGARKAVGFGESNGVQGPALRTANAKPPVPITLADGKTQVEAWFSPNTQAPKKNKLSPTPADLARVYSLMEHAKDAILFLSFLPGVKGVQNIIGTAAQLAKDRTDLLVQGAISDPSALPPALNASEPTTYKTPAGEIKKLPQRALWWPEGSNGRVVMIRAAAITQKLGNLRPELLTAGHAIIHDKIIVIDPLDPVNCTVITGSHNMGYKASYQNDENLLIIRGNQALALSYAVHVLDVYDHYVLRAKLADELRQSLIATGLPPPAAAGGFLKLAPTWQDRWFAAGQPPNSRDYFLP
jgi:phosphatidylserine/phosphatidylglycerophosphate/cardiolipin synthase-like enzyme